VFLSGNGPLVEVLQYTLRNKVFVQDVHGFLKQYGGTATQTPSERVWIYDEAQRAWDEPRAQEQRGRDAVSEPLDFLRLGARTRGGVMVLALIGEGQEIHIGEEAGIAQWNEALTFVGNEWQVACPEHVAHVFKAQNANVLPNNRLSLDQSLRTHLALDVQSWVSHLLNGAIPESRNCSEKLWKDDFPIYVTRCLEHAKRYAREKYLGFEDKRYGLLASSKAKNLERFGIDNSFQATRRVKKGPWFVDNPSEPLSCCKLDSVATEFACQGLELDLPIVAWGDDLVWDEGQKLWQSRIRRSKAKDQHQLRLNSYRVLLTRGRDGLVIYVPLDIPTMETTWEVLKQAGAVDLASIDDR
jgi:DUF2075 family protein